MARPLLTVIMPSYNAERFIAESIESVLAQTVEDWELIVVDDASSDGTLDIVAEFQRRDSRIRLVAEDANHGPADARNRGLDQARGDLIAFLDSDDSYLPDHFEMHLRALRAAPSSIGTYCDFFQVWADYGIERLVRSRTVEDQRREMLLSGYIYAQSLTVLRR